MREREQLAFCVKNENGKIDKRKTRALEKKLAKSCKKIAQVIFDEVGSFVTDAKAYDVDESFWRAASHRAMLTLHKDDFDVWLSAEFGDLFGDQDLKEPKTINTWLDIERLQKAKEKWELKSNKK